MNWTNKLKDILGSFWLYLFNDRILIKNLLDSYSLTLSNITIMYKNWLYTRVQSVPDIIPSYTPYTIFIDATSIRNPYSTLDQILSGEGSIGSYQSSDKYILKIVNQIPDIKFISNSITDSNVTLIKNFDFNILGSDILFYDNPDNFKFKKIKITENGELKIYYICYGWITCNNVINDAVNTFYGKNASKYADYVWDIHVNGASIYRIKNILAKTTDSVISTVEGTVSNIWTEQGYSCIKINDDAVFYSNNTTVNVSVGDTVKIGDPIIGFFKHYNGDNVPTPDVLASIKVMTDAGELTADNSYKSAYNKNNINILPLTGDSNAVETYKDICYGLSNDIYVPYADIPDYVNPLEYILKTLRKGKNHIIAISGNSLSILNDIILVIRNNSIASSLLSIVIKADSDPIPIKVSSFYTKSTLVAVAPMVTIKIGESQADIRSFI